MLHSIIRASWRRRGRDVSAGDDRIRSALQSLSPRRRALVVYRACEEHDEQDSALLFDWSLGTVKSEAAKAMVALGSALAADDVAAALRGWYQDLPAPADPDALVEPAVGQGSDRRRRDLERRVAVFAAVCVIAFAGMVSLSRGGHRVPRFGVPGALVTAPVAPASSNT
jgi:hypothetical protein